MKLLNSNNHPGTEEHPVISSQSVELDPDLKDELLSQVHEEGTVIVHCLFNAFVDAGIRIWPTTFLVDSSTGERSRLLHAENITYAPLWTAIDSGKSYRFTLIFSALPKSCTFFDLLEDIPQPGGFFVHNIKRNKSDIYQVRVD
jgi:hypothetical protein